MLLRAAFPIQEAVQEPTVCQPDISQLEPQMLLLLLEGLQTKNQALQKEVEIWKREVQRLDEAIRRLKDLQKTPREHVPHDQIQLIFDTFAPYLLGLVTPDKDPSEQQEQAACPLQQEQNSNESSGKEGKKKRGHGRQILPENLPMVTCVFDPPNLPEGSVKIGEDVTFRLGYRRASYYRLMIVRPRYSIPIEAALERDFDGLVLASFDGDISTEPKPLSEPCEQTCVDTKEHTKPADDSSQRLPDVQKDRENTGGSASTAALEGDKRRTVVQAIAPLEVIPRGLCTADLLSHIIVSKHADGLPLNRQELIIQREGLHVSRGTMCGWLEAAYDLTKPLWIGMQKDARDSSPVILTDSTGVLVQDKHKCKNGYFWVYVSYNSHVIFRYTPRDSSDEPKDFFRGYKGIIVADATATLDAICNDPFGPDRAGCLAHARRYFYKAIESDREVALIGLGLCNRLFELERDWKELAPSKRLALRRVKSKPVFDALIAFCRKQMLVAPERSAIRAALHYALNNEKELGMFLQDGRVPLSNNRSELELRRLVVGRHAWLFVGSDESAPWTCVFTSLVASCAMNGLDPESYLRDLFRVLPHWPKDRVMELCPRDWKVTRSRLDDRELMLPLGPLTIPSDTVGPVSLVAGPVSQIGLPPAAGP